MNRRAFTSASMQAASFDLAPHFADNLRRYLAHAPRTWRLLDRALAHPACASLAGWFDDHIPRDLRRAPEEHAA